MNYKEQYKHPKWQKRRLEILERDGFKCTTCEQDEVTLHVHHLVYHKNTDVWNYDNNELSTLCEECHEEWHRLKDRIDEYMPADTQKLKEIANMINFVKDFEPPQIYIFRDILSLYYAK